jgi:outer membrane protein
MSFIKLVVPVLTGLILVSNSVYAQKINPPVMSKSEQPVTNSAYEKLLNDADALIKSGKAAAAYALLAPLEFDHAGEVRFDNLLGIAALDSGQPDKATFAFERVLAVEPDFIGARLDMARAYYQLGDMPRARTELVAVQNKNISVEARATIQKYLNAIDGQPIGKQTRFSAYAEGSLGRDNNVNNATSQAQIFVDAYPFSNYTLDSASLKTAASYYDVATGGEGTHNLSTNWQLYAGASLRKRNNIKHAQFNSLGLDEQIGVKYGAVANQIRVGLLAGQYNLGGSRNRNTSGLNMEWRYLVNANDQMNVFAQREKYRFADSAMQVNDFNLGAIGAGWQHTLADSSSVLFGSVYHGSEQDVGGRTNGAKRFNGLRAGVQTTLSARVKLFASVGAQVGNYDKTNFLFLRQRADRQYDLALGAEYQWASSWTARPQLNYLRNQSNIEVYGFNRTEISLAIRRDFK